MRSIPKLGLTLILALLPLLLQAQQLSPLQQKVRAVMDSNLLTPEEKTREAERQPVDVLEFLRLRDDMKVIELLPFGGWYTKVLGQVLSDKGKLYVTQPEVGGYSDDMRAMLALPGLEKVGVVDWNGPVSTGGSPWTASGTWNVEPLDMVLTFRNYHNFGYDDRMAINKSAFDALKSGGYYGVIDHNRRHLEPSTRANGRRVDPVMAIKEIQATGFMLEDYSDLLRREQDDLSLEVGQPEVAGQTDRFILLFRKP